MAKKRAAARTKNRTNGNGAGARSLTGTLEHTRLVQTLGLSRLKYHSTTGLFENILTIPVGDGEFVRQALRRFADAKAGAETNVRAPDIFGEIVRSVSGCLYKDTNGVFQLLAIAEKNDICFASHDETILLLVAVVDKLQTEIPAHFNVSSRRGVNGMFPRVLTAVTALFGIFKDAGEHPPAPARVQECVSRYDHHVWLGAFELLRAHGLKDIPCRFLRLSWLGRERGIDSEAIGVWMRQHWGKRMDDLSALMHVNLMSADVFWSLTAYPELVQALGLKQLKALLIRYNERGREDDILNLARAMREELFPESIPNDGSTFSNDELESSTLLAMLDRYDTSADERSQRGQVQMLAQRSHQPGRYIASTASILLEDFDPLSEVKPVPDNKSGYDSATEIRDLIAMAREELAAQFGSRAITESIVGPIARQLEALGEVLEIVYAGDPEQLLETWTRWSSRMFAAVDALSKQTLAGPRRERRSAPTSSPIAAPELAPMPVLVPELPPDAPEFAPTSQAEVEAAVEAPAPEAALPEPAPESANDQTPEPARLPEPAANSDPEPETEADEVDPPAEPPGGLFPEIPKPFRARLIKAQQQLDKLPDIMSGGFKPQFTICVKLAQNLPANKHKLTKALGKLETEIAEVLSFMAA